MEQVIKREELLNYSMERFKFLVKPGTKVKLFRQEELLVLSGMEMVVSAAGGELFKDSAGCTYIGGEHEPSGIQLLDGRFIGIGSIEYIQLL